MIAAQNVEIDRRHAGFSLIELMIVVVIIGVLAAIAYPAYLNSITKSRRGAAEACLSSYANFMERFYATNMSYFQDTSGNGVATTWPALDCASLQNTGPYYTYSLAAVGVATYTLQAVPQGAQATSDTQCFTLTLDNLGTKGMSGGTDTTVSDCWRN